MTPSLEISPRICLIKGRGTNVNKRFQMWRVRSLTWFHLGRRGSPRGFWLVRATPRWSLLRAAVLVNVPERFLSPQIKTTFACCSEREPSK